MTRLRLRGYRSEEIIGRVAAGAERHQSRGEADTLPLGDNAAVIACARPTAIGSFSSGAALSDDKAMAASLADVERMLSGGDRRALRGVQEVISLVLADTSALDSLFECLFSDDEVVRMRAADALEKIARDQPQWFASYRQRLLTEIAQIDQPSVQWHLAQILAEIELTPKQRDRAVSVLKRNLERYDDWIVINLTLEALALFAREDASLRRELIATLHHHQSDPRKAVAKRATNLLRDLRVRDDA